jgi:histone arginine demethylase JMJD6
MNSLRAPDVKQVSDSELRGLSELPSEPTLITGMTDDWRAASLWTSEFLRDRFGSTEVKVKRGREPHETLTLPLGDYVDYMATTADENPYYLSDWTFRFDCPELTADYEVPACFENWFDRVPQAIRPEWRWIYMGPSGSRSLMHVDVLMTGAWLAALRGKKHWLFYPPGSDESQAPPPLICTQEPGEVMFVPSGWWHQVRNEGVSLSITENFVNESNRQRVREAIEADWDYFASSVRSDDPGFVKTVLRFHVPQLFDDE